jgi:D-alanyl-D-alanine carboxypeptidase
VDAVVEELAGRLAPDPSGPGVAIVAITRDHRSVAVRGTASLEHGRPLTSTTPMYAASLAKLVTAAAVHRCVAAGSLRLDDTLDRWFPTLAGADRIAISSLLQHRSGLPEYHALRLLAGHDVEDRLSADDVIGLVAGMHPWFEPGSRVSYNNTNFAVLAHLVADVTGRPWAEAAAALVLDPIGAVDGGVRAQPGSWFRGMAGCYTAGPGGTWRRATLGCASVGDGGWWASPRDLASLAAALLDGRIGGDDVATPMQAGDALPPGPASGLRSGCTTAGSGRGAWFGGLAEFVGAKAELRVYPAVGVAVGAIANSHQVTLGGALDELVEWMTGVRPEPTEPAPFEPGPAPDGWFLAAGGGAWQVRVGADGTGTANVGTVRFDLRRDGDGWAVPARPSVRVGRVGDEVVVRDGAAELARLTPVDVRPARPDELAMVRGTYRCASARAVLVVEHDAATGGVTVGRTGLVPEAAQAIGVRGDGAVLLATAWGSMAVSADGSGAASLGRAETVPVERVRG